PTSRNRRESASASGRAPARRRARDRRPRQGPPAGGGWRGGSAWTSPCGSGVVRSGLGPRSPQPANVDVAFRLRKPRRTMSAADDDAHAGRVHDRPATRGRERLDAGLADVLEPGGPRRCVGYDDLVLDQPGGVLGRGRHTDARPDVEPDVVVVPTGGEEPGAGVTVVDDVEAEDVPVEPLRGIEFRDVEVHV